MADDSLSNENRFALAQEISKALVSKGFTLSTAESCTGGLLSSAFIDLSGASAFFINGAVTYSNESKTRLLGVKEETLNTVGAVSHETARQMAEGVKRLMNTDVGLSTTGVAGPEGGTAEKPVGLVYIGISVKNKTITKELRLDGSRTEIREKTVICVLKELLKELKIYN